MKRIAILLAAALAFGAQAEVIATAGTKPGGVIRLTNDRNVKCERQQRFMYIRTPQGEVMPGCWELLDNDVFVQFFDGSIRMYPVSGFDMTAEKPVANKGSTL